jgi:DNA/RNA-binding domain of Phe-tRNA-synthetase-like protein
VITALLFIAAVILLLTIVRIRAYDRGRITGRQEGFDHALQMFTQEAEAQAEQAIQKHREFLHQLGVEGAKRHRAAEAARWR